MNIFEYNDMMKMSQNQRPVATLPQPAPMGGGGMIMNHPQGGGIMGRGEVIPEGEEFPKIPEAPKVRGPQGDPSGFANYGMQAPQLPGPMAQLGGLMAINQKANQPRQQTGMPGGGLMAYLLSLGAL